MRQALLLFALLGLLASGLMAGDKAWASVNGREVVSGELLQGPATIQFLDGTKVVLSKNAAVSVSNGYQPTVHVKMGSVSWDLHSKKSLSLQVAKTRYVATEKRGSITVGQSGEYASDAAGGPAPIGIILISAGIATAATIGGLAAAGTFDQGSISPH